MGSVWDHPPTQWGIYGLWIGLALGVLLAYFFSPWVTSRYGTWQSGVSRLLFGLIGSLGALAGMFAGAALEIWLR